VSSASNTYKNNRIKRIRGRTVRSPLSRVRLRQLARGLAACEHEWLSPVRYDPGRPWYQRLTCDDNHEVWLLSWPPGQRAGCPATAGPAGPFAVARGALRELAAPGPPPRPPVPVARGR